MKPPQNDKANDITLTKEETQRLEECFKDKKFRDLLSDYVKEISNPKTKLAYEEYLKQVENEGGAPDNRQLMKPIAAFCIKAKVTANNENNNNNKKHIFINCCSGKLVKDAILGNSSGYDHALNSTGSKKAGLCWQIPYILGLKRFDHNDGSIIYDIAFSPKTIQLSQGQQSFKNFVIQTALEAVDGIEDEYKLFTNIAKHGKKYKILKTNTFKGNIEPPMMSVIVTDDKSTKKRMIDTKTKKTMNYKIIESTDKNIEGCWSDNNLLIEPLQKPKQIYIIIKLEQITSIKDIDCSIDNDKNGKHFINVKVKNNKYKPCKIDLKDYEIIESSMNASWYKQQKELKIAFDIKPFTQKQIKEIQQKYLNLNLNKKENKTQRKIDEIITISQQQNDDGFLLKEIETKRTINKTSVDDNKACDDNDDDDDDEITPLCHHKLPMKQCLVKNEGINKGKSYWVCDKSQDEKCTAFKWNTSKMIQIDKKKIMREFQVEKRVKFDKTVLLIRIRNIIESSVNIQFDKLGEIIIEFETHQYKYYKKLQLKDCLIDIKKSRFDLNCRNLLIMIHKDLKQIEDKQDNINNCVDEILNDSVLFEID